MVVDLLEQLTRFVREGWTETYSLNLLTLEVSSNPSLTRFLVLVSCSNNSFWSSDWKEKVGNLYWEKGTVRLMFVCPVCWSTVWRMDNRRRQYLQLLSTEKSTSWPESINQTVKRKCVRLWLTVEVGQVFHCHGKLLTNELTESDFRSIVPNHTDVECEV